MPAFAPASALAQCLVVLSLFGANSSHRPRCHHCVVAPLVALGFPVVARGLPSCVQLHAAACQAGACLARSFSSCGALGAMQVCQGSGL